MNSFICEICLEKVTDYQPHVRVGADTVVKDQQGAYCSLMSNKVMVFAVYHTDCLKSVNMDDCDDVAYIEEVKELLDAVAGGGEDDDRIVITRAGYLA